MRSMVAIIQGPAGRGSNFLFLFFSQESDGANNSVALSRRL